MAKDDYHVVVYQILAYLYVQLKAGEKIDTKLLQAESNYLNINRLYWSYIIENLYNQGLVSGVVKSKSWGGNTVMFDIENIKITPLGIEYLTDNSFLEKAKEFLKDIKAIVPFI
ncbi:YjcQ family protein [Allofustis seminis]|uniref:YjcQ family protein n=1 Tax=Allofustis seminis TaxID=166939 RepID=UPI00037093E1|nr:YjcQ family protein [Allofustis seminis]